MCVLPLCSPTCFWATHITYLLVESFFSATYINFPASLWSGISWKPFENVRPLHHHYQEIKPNLSAAAHFWLMMQGEDCRKRETERKTTWGGGRDDFWALIVKDKKFLRCRRSDLLSGISYCIFLCKCQILWSTTTIFFKYMWPKLHPTKTRTKKRG